MLAYRIFYAYYFVASALLKDWQVKADEQEYRLVRYLMSNYDPAVRPSVNASLPLKVSFHLSLRQIVEVDEENQVITTNCWLTEKWNDVHLRWNASDFGGISVVRIPSEQVWKPDIVLHNNVDVQSAAPTVHANVILHSTGDIIWLSRGVFKSSCDMDMRFFPFDIQTCILKFSSWTHDINQIELSLEKTEVSVSNFQRNGHFDLDGFTARLSTDRLSCCDQLYHVIIYAISLRRQPLHFMFNLVLPCFIINMVSIFSFYVPCHSGEKITLSVGSLVSIIFLMTIARDSLPHSQAMPMISIYYSFTLCTVALAALLSVLTLSLHHKGLRGAEVPVCLKKIFLGCLAKMLFFSFPTSKKEEEKLKKSSSVDVVRETKVGLDRIEHYTVSPRLRHRSETPIAAVSSSVDTLRPSRSLQGEEQQFERRFLRILHEVHETMERNEQRVAEQAHKEDIRLEWEQVALVCDRLLFFLFMLATFITAFFILFTSATHQFQEN